MATQQTGKSVIGLVGLAVMGQNLALNIAEKGFPISVYNRSGDKTDAAVARAVKEGVGERLHGYKDLKDFVASLERPRRVIILVKAGAPVDATVAQLSELLEPGDIIVDTPNERGFSQRRTHTETRPPPIPPSTGEPQSAWRVGAAVQPP